MSFSQTLARVRFAPERNLAQELLSEPAIRSLTSRLDAAKQLRGARKELLAHAVRVDEAILPEIHAGLEMLRGRAGIEERIECFVYQGPLIEAGVLPARGGWIVVLSSAGVEKLSIAELEFVIGHELGHVAYDHFELPVGAILGSDGGLRPSDAMRLLSWQRKSEISADRAGLLCCGSLEIAATAFFKALTGIARPDLTVEPQRLGAQFAVLRKELEEIGAGDLWVLSHPLAPVRMRALESFWRSETAAALIPEAPGGAKEEDVDREIERLLSYMEPAGRRGETSVDPLLGPLVLWGGLYVASANGRLDASEVGAIAELVGREEAKAALAGPRRKSRFLDEFVRARAACERPLSALGLHRLFAALVTIARADGAVSDEEILALEHLAQKLGIVPSYVESLLTDIG